jgi:hypothetical protein
MPGFTKENAVSQEQMTDTTLPEARTKGGRKGEGTGAGSIVRSPAMSQMPSGFTVQQCIERGRDLGQVGCLVKTRVMMPDGNLVDIVACDGKGPAGGHNPGDCPNLEVGWTNTLWYEAPKKNWHNGGWARKCVCDGAVQPEGTERVEFCSGACRTYIEAARKVQAE